MSVVLAGGGTAGHIEPALAVGDALRRLDPGIRVTALGTARGLEGTLIPARGYDFELIPPVPMPRRPTLDLARLPVRLVRAVRRTRDILDRVGADVVVGFGGYVAFPAYLAARLRRTPIVVHEQNPLPGLANRVAARFAKVVAVTTEGTPLPRAQVVGMPLRRSITTLDRSALRPSAAAHFGLAAERATLLVTGGSQGARSLNAAATGAAQALGAAGVQVLHISGPKNTVEVTTAPGGASYVVVPYADRMDLAYAAADMLLCRAGAVTCAELAAVGLPAAYVPYPVGNGEQRLNAQPIVEAGGGLLVDDADLSPQWIIDNVVPVLSDPEALARMTANAKAAGRPDADDVMARLVLAAAS
ncbi:MAG: undecaprenyldiphospho-muramoylpentapeptide beta-N-acetylglucosaminyltransferase [Geodermatophilaceae bacterium]|nr:undecaprenyldiphospho-muramoylpentapeptide beta-N-acetylglucosaminyltransferase [Geodermatophilaceae bacterium]